MYKLLLVSDKEEIRTLYRGIPNGKTSDLSSRRLRKTRRKALSC